MKKYFSWVRKYRIDELSNCFFINSGVLFIMVNVVNRYWPTEKEPSGGFIGQLLFALVIAVSSTYFSASKSTKDSDKIETSDIT